MDIVFLCFSILWMSLFLVNEIFAQLYSLRLVRYIDTQEELVGLRFLLFD
jgi:hypothetical protein